MPALTRVRVSALAELAEGQRFTPARTVVRQIERIERLALEIDRDGMYAEDWVAHRITGFKPRVEDPRLIVGAALLGDLSALAERLSEAARLTDEPGSGMVGIDALASMWDVSRKTIERYRRDGLIGRRVRAPDGPPSVVRIVFAPAIVEGFTRVRTPRIARAGAFTRISDADRARAVRWATAYRAKLGWTMSQAVARAAVRLGRSQSAVRRALENADDPALAHRDRVGPRERRLVERALAWGIEASRIGARIYRTRATVHRIALEARRARIADLDLSTPMDDRLTEKTAQALVRTATARSGIGIETWETVWAAVAHARRGGTIDAETERTRALAYHALRWLVRTEAAHGIDHPAKAEGLDRMETRLRWASQLKRSLVAAEITLIVRTIESIAGEPCDRLAPGTLAALFLGGSAIVGAAVDGADAARGGRIAGAAALPLTRWLTARVESFRAERTPHARRKADDAVSIDGWDRALVPWDAWTRAPGFAESRWTRVEGESRRALACRFGLEGEHARTMPEVGRTLGCGARRAGILVMHGILACRGMRENTGG